jgi:predicted TIM-barrel enzyme
MTLLDFKNRFSARTQVILPVIHVESQDQALRNTEVAKTAGCDGVFLINHSIYSEELLGIAHRVRDSFPDWWIGVNCLDLAPEAVFACVDEAISGIWVDNAFVDERTGEQPVAERVLEARRQSGWQGLYFGGVAFKYQREVQDLAAAARSSVRYVDVVTTSGPGTGRAASTSKIAAMKNGLGDAPLAIASGITPENVGDYLEVADCFLVATGISRNFFELDPAKVGALMNAVRNRRE